MDKVNDETKDVNQEVKDVNDEVKDVNDEVKDVNDEVQAIKYTIKTSLKLIREYFNADVCYLYLIDKAVDKREKRILLNERLVCIKEAYREKQEEIPRELINCYYKNISMDSDEIIKSNDKEIIKSDGDRAIESISVLKFIDFSKNEKVKWNANNEQRPPKYVVFNNLPKYLVFNKLGDNICPNINNSICPEIVGEGLTAYIVRSNNQIIINSEKEFGLYRSCAYLNHEKDIAEICEVMLSYPLTHEGKCIGVIKIEYFTKQKEKYSIGNTKVKEVQCYVSLLIQLIVSGSGCELLKNISEKVSLPFP